MRIERNTALTPGAPHVRDAVDLRWVMRTVLVALAPCVAFGMYNTGFQANHALRELGLDSGFDSGPGWREALLAWVGAGRDPSSLTDCFVFGALCFLPLLAIALTVGELSERVFASARRKSRVAGLGVTAWLFTASLPPTFPWWQAALGMSFGIVVGKEIFGGTGRNVFNPAVVGLAFLYFAYPAQMRGQGIWVAIDGTTGPTTLRVATAGGAAALAEHGTSWFDAFLGRIPGAMGETSTLACLLGAAILVHQRVASWRIMLGVLLGALLGAAATGGSFPGPSWGWHPVLGSLAFGAVFLATDPVTSATTELGRWVYGLLVGFLVVLIRVANPVHTEGVLLAILLGNIAAPLIDHGVIRLHVRKRRRRHGRT